jgi:hypothetical protein
MSQVSRPVQVLLAVTVLFALAWFVALRPKSNVATESAAPPAQTTQAAPGTEGLTNAVGKAQDAVTTANGAAQSSAGAAATPPAATGSAPTQAPAPQAQTDKPASGTTGASKHSVRTGGASAKSLAAARGRVRVARTALRQHKALAIAFVDPHTADARAVGRELQHVSHFGGRAVTLVAPLAQLSDYGFITRQVEVTVAPTVVIVDGRHRATTIVGFTDRGEIEQRLADALPAKHRK